MTRRQIRELVILVVVVVAGVLIGMAARIWRGPSPTAQAPRSPAGGAVREFVSIPDNRVVARLEGEAITGAVLNRYVNFHLGIAGVDIASLPPDQIDFIRHETLNQMAEERILERYAKERDIEVTAEELAAKLAEARSFYESDEEFEKDVREGLHVTAGELKAFMRNLLLKEKVLAGFEPAEPITEEQVKRELASVKERMEKHPGGPVEITKDLVRSHLEERARLEAYTKWLEEQLAALDFEIIEPSLVAPPFPAFGEDTWDASGAPSAKEATAAPPTDDAGEPKETQ